MIPLRRFVAPLLVVGLLVGVIFFLRTQFQMPRVSERDVAQAIHAAIQREADTTFVVTGYLEVVATTRSEDTRVLLPSLLNLRLGTTRATVRVPGRVSYGFDATQLTPDMIQVLGDTIEIVLPLISVFSAEPDLARLEVETTTGWARAPVTAQEAERRAVQLLTEALQRQGEAHVRQSTQPEVNTARALRRIADPVVAAMGLADPHYRIYLGEGVLVEP